MVATEAVHCTQQGLCDALLTVPRCLSRPPRYRVSQTCKAWDETCHKTLHELCLWQQAHSGGAGGSCRIPLWHPAGMVLSWHLAGQPAVMVRLSWMGKQWLIGCRCQSQDTAAPFGQSWRCMHVGIVQGSHLRWCAWNGLQMWLTCLPC